MEIKRLHKSDTLQYKYKTVVLNPRHGEIYNLWPVF